MSASQEFSQKASKLPHLELARARFRFEARAEVPPGCPARLAISVACRVYPRLSRRGALLFRAFLCVASVASRTGCCGTRDAREVASSWRAVQPAEACKHLLRSRGTVATRQPDEHSQKARATSRLPNTSRTRSSRRLETLADLLCSPSTYSPVRTLKRSRTNAFVRRLATPVGCRASPVREGWMRTRPA